jgi:protein-S-isoprenylcysteine O-methyltransferase Ste14
MIEATLSPQARVKLAARTLAGLVFMLGFLFIAAGRWDYWQGWVYVAVNLMIFAVMGMLATRNAALVEERLRPGEGMKTWDKFYFALSTPMYIIALPLAGLDARYGWTNGLSPLVYWGAVVVYLMGQAIFLWARFTNNYFSSVVRIQVERGQTVCKDGPYRYIRHPGYLGGILFAGSMGLMLGSVWATLPQLFACLLLVVRTALEDKTLQAELPGYREFTQETRYRLLPGVW